MKQYFKGLAIVLSLALVFTAVPTYAAETIVSTETIKTICEEVKEEVVEPYEVDEQDEQKEEIIVIDESEEQEETQEDETFEETTVEIIDEDESLDKDEGEDLDESSEELPEEEKTEIELTSNAVNGMVVTLKANADAFPNNNAEELELVVVEASDNDAEKAEEELEEISESDNIAKRITYDISVKCGDESVEPEAEVKVEFSLTNVPSGADEVKIYHHEEDEVNTVVDESIDAEDKDDITVEGETESFSLYTVDFTYAAKTVSITGDTDHNKLADILSQIDITEEIVEAKAYQDVACEIPTTDGTVYDENDNALFKVYEEDEWYVDAISSFSTEHGLYVKTKNAEYKVKVTDPVANPEVQYRYPVYNTKDNPKSGIKEWKTGTIVNYTKVTNSSSQVIWNAGWYVVEGNVNLSAGVKCNGAVNLILKDDCKLKVTLEYYRAGIQVNGDDSLAIYAQSTGDKMGHLDAQGGTDKDKYGSSVGGAGIGGSYSSGPASHGKNITINGGCINARGGINAAGIGGGCGEGDTGHGENIIINGGKITAIGGEKAAGIGGGKGIGNNIVINDGTITASGGCDGADGIGRGCDGSFATGITASSYVTIKAGNSNPPTSEIAHTTGVHMSDLRGKRYVTTVEIPKLTLTAASKTQEYDGSELIAATYSQIGTLKGSDTLTVTVSGCITNVGTTTNAITSCWISRGGTNVTSEYVLTTQPGILEVTKKHVIMTSASASKTYDGASLSTASVTDTGFATGEGVESYNVTGSQLLAGTSSNTFTYTLKAGTNADNYEIEKVEGVLTVNKITTPIIITANSKSKMYDGIAVTDSGCTCTNGVLVSGDVLTANALPTSSLQNVGTISNVVDSYKVTRGTTDVTSCYTFGTAVPGTLSVTKRPITFTSASATKEYDGTPLVDMSTPSVGGDGFVAEEGVDFVVTGSQSDAGTSKNTFTYTAKGGTNLDNYEVTVIEGDLTVTEKPSSSGGEYSGTSHGAISTGKWIKNADESWSFGSNGIARLKNTWANIVHEKSKETDWYYFGNDGKALTGFQTINGKTYYFREVKDSRECAMETGWQFINKKWYHFSTSKDANAGAMTIGWYLDDDNSWYFMSKKDNNRGMMQTGWIVDPDDGHMYYLDPINGSMTVGRKVIGGKRYYFNEIVNGFSGWSRDDLGVWIYEKKNIIPRGAMRSG